MGRNLKCVMDRWSAMIPAWLAKHLETTGAGNPDRIGRAARIHH